MTTDDPDEAIADLVRMGAAALTEAGGSPLAPRIRPMWPGARVGGRAFAVCCGDGDNLALHAALVAAPPGSVLCVEVDGDADRAFWGEVLTTAALARGVTGVVIDGGLRDVAALERLGFGAFATGPVLAGATRAGGGFIGATAIVGGVAVETGDVVVGDGDGVAVVRAGSISDALALARRQADSETELLGRLRDGATTADLMDLDLGEVHQPDPDRGPLR